MNKTCLPYLYENPVSTLIFSKIQCSKALYQQWYPRWPKKLLEALLTCSSLIRAHGYQSACPKLEIPLSYSHQLSNSVSSMSEAASFVHQNSQPARWNLEVPHIPIPSAVSVCHTLAVLMIRRGLISASRLSACASALRSPEPNSISCKLSDASTSSPSVSSVMKSTKPPPEKTCCCFCRLSWSEETLLVSLSRPMLVSKYRPQLLFWGVSGLLLLLDLIVFLGWWSLHVDCCGHSPVASKTGQT